MDVKNEQSWGYEKSLNPKPKKYGVNAESYSYDIISYAEKWADLMEEAFAKGFLIQDFAMKTSLEAAETVQNGLTFMMNVMAARILVKHWIHGDLFLEWYNTHWQLKNEGQNLTKKGQLINPAVMEFNGEKGALIGEYGDSPIARAVRGVDRENESKRTKSNIGDNRQQD